MDVATDARRLNDASGLFPGKSPQPGYGKRKKAASGFEPLHRGFADLSLSHLGTPPLIGAFVPQGLPDRQGRTFRGRILARFVAALFTEREPDGEPGAQLLAASPMPYNPIVLAPIATAALLVLVTVSPATGDVYRWVDERGTIHLDDDLARVPEAYREAARVFRSKPARV